LVHSQLFHCLHKALVIYVMQLKSFSCGIEFVRFYCLFKPIRYPKSLLSIVSQGLQVVNTSKKSFRILKILYYLIVVFSFKSTISACLCHGSDTYLLVVTCSLTICLVCSMPSTLVLWAYISSHVTNITYVLTCMHMHTHVFVIFLLCCLCMYVVLWREN